MSIFEQSGTITVTNGSREVIGTGTAWLDAYDGVALNIEGLTFPVETIDSATKLTLVKPYPGASEAGVVYTFVPIQPTNYQLSKKVQEVLDVAGELVDAMVGPQGPAGPAGPQGIPGKSGDAGFGAIVNFADYKPQPAGGSGVYMIIPVVNGDPDGLTLTQSATVILPSDKPNAGAGIWIRSTTSGYALTIGLTNAPEPQPEVPGEDIDLSGEGTVFGAPNSIFDLGIYLGGTSATSFNLTLPAGLPILIKSENASADPVASQWRTGSTGSPYPVTGNAVDSGLAMNKYGSEAGFGYRNGNIVINDTGYISTSALALNFRQTGDDRTTQTPDKIRLTFRGVIPAENTFGVMASLMDYQVGEFRLEPYWDGPTLKVILGRNGSIEDVVSPPSELRQLGTLQTYEAEWTNNPNGDGGSMMFYIDGQPMGAAVPTNTKPRITPNMPLEVNASSGNLSVAMSNMEVEYVGLSYDKPATAVTYRPAASGTISRADLENLVADATNVGASGPYRLLYAVGAGEPFALDITIGEMALPAGRAYKAVLEDWSTGAGIEHPNHLVMTRVAAQNCRFEDADLFGSQAAWTEVLPQGPVPNINGINYYCEGIRIGNYVQFQFIYDWDTTQMPANPFGDPVNKESYMVPHKWKIYDSAGTLLARIEQHNGEPLNNASRPALWEGSIDGRGVGIITENNRWIPHGTVRSSVIWRSHDPVAYSQGQVWRTVPTFDQRAPFACSTGYSVNGGDARIFGDGQINGFGNIRTMSYEPTDTNGILAQAAASPSPWEAGLTDTAITPNAGVWIKYTPFNIQGRSPVTGPGGVRDDRQLMPEPIAFYARDNGSTRSFDNRPWKQIALDYLTGYASDSVYGMENGRARPIYKSDPRRPVTLRNHYYGAGNQNIPANQSWYLQGGRTYEWQQGNNPLRVRVPYAGTDPKKPVFGTFMIDKAHSHQYPHWGSMLFQTPEFAMMGHKFSDQSRLYANNILADDGDPNLASNRETAWAFIHAVLMWKTASANSSRLYSRKDVMDWVVFDFETFYDQHYASNPGFLNPPTNIFTNGQVDMFKAAYASNARFGITTCYGDRVYNHDFMIGYWLQALHAGEKLGFNQALRDASPKAKAVIDWLIISHRKRIVGRVNDGMLINAEEGTEYMTALWTMEQINAAGGNVASLPQNYAQVAASQTKPSPSWDTCHDQYGNVQSRDGQSMDQFLAGPALLIDMGLTGTDLTAALNKAEGHFQQKLQEETAKGDQAGTGWFVFHQATNNRPYKPAGT